MRYSIQAFASAKGIKAHYYMINIDRECQRYLKGLKCLLCMSEVWIFDADTTQFPKS